MALKKSSKPGPRRCPNCQMCMIVVDGFGLDPECKTFECLQCGNIEKPKTITIEERAQAAE
jgi:hypothetical protein